MARKLRVEYPGAVYHLLNRGDRREPIFRDDRDRLLFIETLGQVCRKTGWQVHAVCLMPNHFHLVIETPSANLVAGMKWFLGTYTGRFNRRHKLFGHLFSGRYKALIVDASGNGYLKTVCDYVHLNPVRARLLAPGQKLSRYRWSSYPAYLLPPGKRPQWLRVDRLLGEHGLQRDTRTSRREFAVRMEARRAGEAGRDWKEVRRGWCLGGGEFKDGLLEEMRERAGQNYAGEERRESEEAWARKLLEEKLDKLGWTQEQLASRGKGDKHKVRIACQLRRETTMTLQWMADKLNMGTAGSLANLLRNEKQT